MNNQASTERPKHDARKLNVVVAAAGMIPTTVGLLLTSSCGGGAVASHDVVRQKKKRTVPSTVACGRAQNHLRKPNSKGITKQAPKDRSTK